MLCNSTDIRAGVHCGQNIHMRCRMCGSAVLNRASCHRTNACERCRAKDHAVCTTHFNTVCSICMEFCHVRWCSVGQHFTVVTMFVDSFTVCHKCSWRRHLSDHLRRRRKFVKRRNATLMFKTDDAIPTVEKALLGGSATTELDMHTQATTIHSPHILPVLYATADDESQTITLHLPYIMPLQFLECCSRYRLRSYIRQLIAGLRDLHSCGIVHGDIKPDNILMSKRTGKVLIIDFGLASERDGNGHLMPRRFSNHGAPRAGKGTAGYRAPEVLTNTTPYQSASDMWSVGIVLMCLIMRRLPPPMDYPEEANAMCRLIGTDNWGRMVEQTAWSKVEVDVLRRPESETEWRRICRGKGSANALALLKSLLQPYPQERPTAEQCLLHPFLM